MKRPARFWVYKIFPGKSFVSRVGQADTQAEAFDIVEKDKKRDSSFGGLVAQGEKREYKVFEAEWTEVQLPVRLKG